MKAADRSGAAVAVIVGPDELAAGVVTLRALRALPAEPRHDEQQAERRQEAVPRTGLVDAVRAWLTS
jgi:histidyl-tRNA synthetase